jgi:hypothetical protein
LFGVARSCIAISSHVLSPWERTASDRICDRDGSPLAISDLPSQRARGREVPSHTVMGYALDFGALIAYLSLEVERQLSEARHEQRAAYVPDRAMDNGGD